MTFKKVLASLYNGRSGAARRFRYGLLAFDVAVVIFVIVTSFFERSPLTEVIDVVIGLGIATDFSARLWISKNVFRDLIHPAGVADMIVIGSLLAPVAGEGFAFLRVIRTLRLLRSYQILIRLRRDFSFFRRNEIMIQSALNLAVFVFITTALVFETQHATNPDIANYADALYFTVTTLTTTGFGDITLPGPTGRLLSVAIMIFGVSLFVRLIQVLFRPPKVEYECPDCGLSVHDHDAIHCKHCGRVLHISNTGEN